MFQFDKQPNNTVILIGKLTAVIIYSLLLFLILFTRERIIIFFIPLFIIYLLTRFAYKNLTLSIYVKELIHDFNQGFSSLQQIIGNASNFIILFVTYFIGVGSIWLITRITKKKFLNLETKNSKSYWLSSNMGKESRDKYYRQF